MIRIAFDLRRASLVALDEKARADAAERHRGRVEERLAWNRFLGLPDVGNDRLLRLARARRDAGERKGGAHHPEKFAPLDRIGDLFDRGRELVVQPLPECGILRQFVERSPEGAAHWWHVEQLVSF